MKLVAVSQRVDEYPDRNEIRDALDQQLNYFLCAAGYLAVPVSNGVFRGDAKSTQSRCDFDVWATKIGFDAILLSGGNDIGTCLERDETEACLLDYAARYHLPVLGICRGMQMMGVWAGVELKKVENHVCTRHELIGEITREVNSFHNQSIKDCPSDFLVLALSKDNQIEAIRHNTFPWEGWMWHPERENCFQTQDIQRLKALFGD